MNRASKKLIKKKYNLYRKYLLTKSREDYGKYIAVRNECKLSIRKAKRKYECLLATYCKSNPKMFWKHVHSQTKTMSGISPLLKENGDFAVKNEDKANTLNQYFSSVFIQENPNGIPRVDEGER